MSTECPLCGDEYEIICSHISRSHTKEEYESVLLEELQRLANEYDRTPTIQLMKSEGKFGGYTYEIKFGSWNGALQKAGLELNNKYNISREELLEELQRLADEYDRTPTIRLMKSEGGFSPDTYKQKFDSWNKALKEAGLEINESSMCGMNQSVYVLDCGNDKYYVGASAHPEERLQEHKTQGRKASNWAKEHGVEERIYLSDPIPHEEAYQKEREKTLELMREHGWQNVRGSCWLSVELESPPKFINSNE